MGKSPTRYPRKPPTPKRSMRTERRRETGSRSRRSPKATSRPRIVSPMARPTSPPSAQVRQSQVGQGADQRPGQDGDDQDAAHDSAPDVTSGHSGHRIRRGRRSVGLHSVGYTNHLLRSESRDSIRSQTQTNSECMDCAACATSRALPLGRSLSARHGGRRIKTPAMYSQEGTPVGVRPLSPWPVSSRPEGLHRWRPGGSQRGPRQRGRKDKTGRPLVRRYFPGARRDESLLG